MWKVFFKEDDTIKSGIIKNCLATFKNIEYNIPEKFIVNSYHNCNILKVKIIRNKKITPIIAKILSVTYSDCYNNIKTISINKVSFFHFFSENNTIGNQLSLKIKISNNKKKPTNIVNNWQDINPTNKSPYFKYKENDNIYYFGSDGSVDLHAIFIGYYLDGSHCCIKKQGKYERVRLCSIV